MTNRGSYFYCKGEKKYYREQPVLLPTFLIQHFYHNVFEPGPGVKVTSFYGKEYVVTRSGYLIKL